MRVLSPRELQIGSDRTGEHLFNTDGTLTLFAGEGLFQAERGLAALQLEHRDLVVEPRLVVRPGPADGRIGHARAAREQARERSRGPRPAGQDRALLARVERIA